MNDAYRSGQIAGALLGTGLLLLGVVWCAAIARRRTASAPCVYGLGLVLLGWTVFSIPGTAELLSPGVQLPAPVFYVIGFALIGAGGVSAIVGLVLYSRSPHYVQGRRQAIVALSIAGILGLAFFVGLTVRAVRLIQERQDSAGAASSAPAEPIVHQDLNFSFRQPGRPWVVWDAKKVNPAVTFGLMRSRPQTFFMAIAESGLDADTAGLVSIARANLQSASDESQIGDDQVHRVGNMDGVRFYADVKKGKHDLTYVFWVFARGGFGYQLITFGRQSDREVIRRDADDLIARFRQIDSARTHEAEKPEPLEAYRSDDLGVAADLAGAGWFEWKGLAKSNPEAAWGGLREDGGGFLVTPLVFDAQPPPRLEAVTGAVLGNWDIEYPSPDVTQARTFERSGLRGQVLRHTRKVGETEYDYRFTVMAGRGHGAFVAVWSHRGETSLDDWARALDSRLRIAAPRLAADQLPTPLRAYQARVHNHLGLSAFEARDYRQATPLFQAAVRFDPQDRVYLVNALQSFSRAEQWKEGLAYLQLPHPTRQDDEVRSWEAWMLKESGRRDEALAIYGPLFAGAYRGDEDFEAYAGLLAAAGRFDDFKRAHDRYLDGHESAKLRRAQARLLGQAGRDTEALAVLDRLRPATGFDAELAWARMQHLRALERHRERIAVCEELIKNGFASYDAYYEKGDAETSLHWYQRAKASFEEALKQKPGDADAKEYVQQVSALLGEGNNSVVKDALEPVPLPSALTARLGTPAPAGEGTRYVHWVDGFAFRKGEEARSTSRRRILVADQAGVERFSTLEVNFDPLFEAVYVNELTVRDAQGRVVAKGQPSDYYVVDKQGDLATHDKTLFVPVPGLAAGHEVDFTVTRRERGAPQAFGYRALRMVSDLAIGLRAAYYLGDPRAIRHRAAGGAKAENVPGGLMWKIENVPGQPSEPLRARSERVRAGLWLGDAAADWSALGREYLTSIEPKLAPAAATDALSRRLTRGRTDRQQILDQVAAHVHRDYVYKALEFGRRGRIPNPPAQTIRSKFGDCKDHAVLMQGLLRSAGVASHLALVSTDDDLQADLPSLEQFNHMVLFVPAAAGAPARFYDATDKGIDPRLSPPLGLAGRSALVLDPAQPRFERIAPYAPHSSQVRVARTVRLGKEPDLSVSEKVEITGYFAASLRDHLATLDAREQREWGQRVVSAAARGARLSSLAVANVGDASKPLVVDAAYALRQQCSTDAGGMRCPLEAPWEGYYLEADTVADRRSAFELEYPLEIASSTTVRGDTCGRMTWEQRPAEGKAEFVAWSARDSVQDRAATLAFDAAILPGTFAAPRYDEYVRQMDLAVRSVTRSVTCAP